MFGQHHTLKQLSAGVAVAASVAVVAVPSALGMHDSWYRNAVSQTASRQSVPFITDTLGGNGHVTKATPDVLARYVANHAGPATQAQSYRFITDTLGGNGQPSAASPSGSTFNWGDAGIGAGMVGAGLLLLLVCVARLRMNKRPAITT